MVTNAELYMCASYKMICSVTDNSEIHVFFDLVCTFQPFEFEVFLYDLVMYNDHMYNDHANHFLYKGICKEG
jgi:hypothetical protein